MHPIWTLVADRASLAVGSLRAAVSPAKPAAGLRELTWQSQPVAAVPLQLHTPVTPAEQPPLSEAYLRGADLVAAYAQSSSAAVQPHIYWRASLCDESVVGVEAIVSMQTSLLDSQPKSQSISHVTASEVLLLDLAGGAAPQRIAQGAPPLAAPAASCLFLFRLASDLSYAEMVHPSDFVSAELSYASADAAGLASQATLNWTLFPERLEKGVIRRTRIAGWFLPTANDAAVAVRVAERFTREPPPLTA